jgi:hypothetical protein
MRRVYLAFYRRRNKQVAKRTKRRVVMIHKYERGRPSESVPGRGWLGRYGLHEVVGIAKRAKFNDVESDELISLNGVVDIGIVKVA